MKHAGPFTREFWVTDDIEYQHEPKVIQFPSRHAKANASQAAQLLEQDRANMRADLRSDLMRQRRDLELELARIDAALMELAGA